MHPQKMMRLCPCRDMDESGNHNSQPTDKNRKSNTTCSHSYWLMNNENTWTQGGEHHTLESVVGGQGRNNEEGREVGEG